jgi:predicted RNA methylase
VPVPKTDHRPTPLGNRRVTGKEQFYTPEALAQQLVTEVHPVVGGLTGRTILEPAGGTGAFIKAALSAGASEVISFDIDPKFDGVSKGDFLAQKLELKDAIALSNPPFGRNNSLSIPFFNKAADHCEYIAFVVPRSWRKWSVLNRLDRRFHLVGDHDIQVDYVDDQGQKLGQQLRLNTCFQIWRRDSEKLRPLYRVRDMNLIEKTKPEDADIALDVFGFNCGKVRTEFARKPNSTQMFLKLLHPQALDALQSVDFSRFYRNTAYTEALSLQEINFLLNERILGNPMLEEKS